MLRRSAPALLGLFVCLFAAHLAGASGALGFDEAKTRLSFGGRQTRVRLEVRNGTGRDFKARLRVELLDPKDAVRASSESEVAVRRGTHSFETPLELRYAELAESDREAFPWFRLRFRLTPDAGEGAAAEGVVSVSEITPDLFELRVVSPSRTRAGSAFSARVRASNPLTQRPVKGVAVEAAVKFDDGEDEAVVKASGTTDGEGLASLDFTLPRAAGDDDGDVELKVTARRGSFVQEAADEISVAQEPRVLLTTDKPLYQPGQTAHMRALVFDPSERALAGEEVTFRVEDEEGQTAFSETFKTSRFGVASADWRVPEGARLGTYELKLELDDERYDEDYGASTEFKVSRYDLPNFSVTTEPDRPFYLAGQNPSVEVRADYLFGQPVKRGRVRVVRQNERRWNYKEQKYETEEQPAAEGVADEHGRFHARLDLSAEQNELAGSGYERFRDLDFAAYVTDPTTQRTEQRRFSLRLTKEPVHVYVSEGRYAQAKGLPLAFYLSTFYADGTPAECDVTAYGEDTTKTSPEPDGTSRDTREPGRALFKVRTNRYGVAKVSAPAVARGEGRYRLPVRFVARDRRGGEGRHVEDFWLGAWNDGASEIRVETDKTIYRAGEPLAVELTSDSPDMSVVVVDAVSRGRVLFSKAVRLSGGRAAFSVPTGAGFEGAVTVAATSATPMASGGYYGDSYSTGARTVVFPRDRELKLDVKLSQKSFRPGEEAGAQFSLRAADGRRAAGALGVVVFDKAVEERARTDGESSRPFGFAGSLEDFWYEGAELAGVTRRDVERLDPSRRPPEGFETVAEMLYNGARPDEVRTAATGDEFDRDLPSLFSELVNARLGRLKAVLAAQYELTADFPADEAALTRLLAGGGVDFNAVRDPWGQPYRPHFFSEREFQRLDLYSNGADERPETEDDFTVARFLWPDSRRTAEAAGRAVVVKASAVSQASSGGTGAIKGTVTDPNGAVVIGVRVTARHNFASLEYSAETDAEGVYLLRDLPSGVYTLTFDAASFKRVVIEQVRVLSSNLTKMDVAMEVAGVSETVEVSGQSAVVDTSSSQTASAAKRKGALQQPPLSTPRLREFFPETLVWSPELETARDGTASLKFKLADNITTWKMSVIASTEDGRLGTFEHEFLAFQPFFVEHDPPRVLTEGDEISLPVVLRNYLGRAQGVDVEMKPEAWFALGGAARRHEEVAAGEAARPTFDFRAVASVKDGRQRVTAYGAEASDAVEKPVTVHPDGEERSLSDGIVFAESAALVARVPADVIRSSLRGELKLYPNLSAHLVEGVEAIMERPHGCGEQTVSSTYPSVLVLGYYGKGAAAGDAPPVVARAERYARLGYERLLGYRAPGGGFTYWGRGEPDLALTAYALRFLNDARRVIEVDADVVDETRAWLLRQQREDGSWPSPRWHNSAEDARQTALTTAFIARVLAATQKADGAAAAVTQAAAPQTQTAAPQNAPPRLTPLQNALRYLTPRADEADDPYLVASFALAAADAGEASAASRAVARLLALARDEGPVTFWEQKDGTPFYGWGLAGRVETTALAVQALKRYCGLLNADCGSKEDEGRAVSNQPSSDPRADAHRSRQLIDRGLVFLLRNKDRYGVWHSTQATINVFDALLSAAAPTDAAAERRGGTASAADTAEVFVNGRRAGQVALPASGRPSAPLTLDLSAFIDAGDNRVEIRRAGHARQAQAQLVTTFYVPWPARREAADAGALRLSVGYDRADAGVGDEVTCSVEAVRRGGGRGMLLAEVGLPPGADVDRASLERAMEESGWALSRYDVLPDRLVVYLWPRGDSARFRFKFRPRYGLNALTAPSQLYDYYNPDARTVVPPTRFVVR